MIVDDGSTDDSWEVLTAIARTDDRIRLLRRERGPKGACTCRNIGVTESRGSHLLFLDTDD
jgi:glycosyltransferase involved in cell wall biosynthesis